MDCLHPSDFEPMIALQWHFILFAFAFCSAASGRRSLLAFPVIYWDLNDLSRPFLLFFILGRNRHQKPYQWTRRSEAYLFDPVYIVPIWKHLQQRCWLRQLGWICDEECVLVCFNSSAIEKCSLIERREPYA